MASTGLRVRQHERREIDLEAELVIGEAHRAQVRLSASSGIPEAFVVPCRLDDISAGGAGVISSYFIPRQISGTLRVFGKHAAAVAANGAPIRCVIFEQPVRVRRVWMRDLAPTYALGVSFSDPDVNMDHRIQAVLVESGAEEADCA